jgi:hypothetical protein
VRGNEFVCTRFIPFVIPKFVIPKRKGTIPIKNGKITPGEAYQRIIFMLF